MSSSYFARTAILAPLFALAVAVALMFHAQESFAKKVSAGACVPQAECCKVCDKGEPCGDACLPAGKKCAIKQKECKEGKPCGDSCIAKDAKCTKREHCACKKADICAADAAAPVAADKAAPAKAPKAPKPAKDAKPAPGK